MIPLRDNIPSRCFPGVTVALIVINVAVFLHELALGPRLEAFTLRYGIVPAFYTDADLRGWAWNEAGWGALLQPIFASMFLHGGFMHIIGNLWVLWIFGDNVEDRLGHARYLLFYLMGGVAAGLLHIATNWGSQVPTIGASGAIAGVMGAYFVLYPRAKVLTLVPLGFILDIVALPAVIFLGFWFLLQLLSGTFGLFAGSGAGGIAFWAHIGGFVFGMLLVKRFVPRPPRLAGHWELLR
ncbi:MAG: rhomboid family intramembrane serine protease [Verrucomicrobia bacterium]|nr:rhomboid family intramembrane serine protease [Verrucomicrobiota bacterium]